MGCAGEARHGQDAPAAVRFQAIICETRLAADRIPALDAARLAQAPDLARALEELGKTRILYSVDQSVALAGDQINISKREPVVTASRVMEGGRAVNTVQYQQVGAIFKVAGRPAGPGRLDVDLSIETASLTDSSARISDGTIAPTIRSAVMSHKGPVDLGKPAVLLSADAASKDADGNAVAHVCRVLLTAPLR